MDPNSDLKTQGSNVCFQICRHYHRVSLTFGPKCRWWQADIINIQAFTDRSTCIQKTELKTGLRYKLKWSRWRGVDTWGNAGNREGGWRRADGQKRSCAVSQWTKWEVTSTQIRQEDSKSPCHTGETGTHTKKTLSKSLTALLWPRQEHCHWCLGYLLEKKCFLHCRIVIVEIAATVSPFSVSEIISFLEPYMLN